MITQTYQQIINEGLMGLPSEALAEIADFVFFMRKRRLQPEFFQEEMKHLSINEELHQMSRDEEIHLEKEFENYDKLYPRR